MKFRHEGTVILCSYKTPYCHRIELTHCEIDRANKSFDLWNRLEDKMIRYAR